MNIAITLYILAFVVVFVVGILEVIKDVKNPLPKFANGDKRIDDINIEKTHKIS